MKREILIYGNPRLRDKAKPVDELTPELKTLVDDMAEAMYETHGIGLAATQVGVPARLIVIDVDQIEDEDGNRGERKLQVFYNPEIIDESAEDEKITEGCLSVPGIEGDVFRPIRVRLKARDAEFNEVEFDTDGLLARCLQHEIDHLDGVLFVERMGKMARVKLTTKLAVLRRKGAAQARAESA